MKKILVVDDEPDIRLILTTLLGVQGYEVDIAEDGRRALTKLQEVEYDLMLLDLMMPHVDGFEVLRRLPAALLDRMPVIVLTAKTAQRDILDGYAGGATCFVKKPFANREMVDIVKYLLGELPPDQRARVEELL